MPANEVNEKKIYNDLSWDDGLQRYLFQVFTPVALVFLVVYAVLQARAGLFELATLYTVVAAIIAVNQWAIQFHNRLALAANVFAALGPIVLLPWQVTGGISGSGLMWFQAYVIFAMLFVPGRGGSFWVMFTYLASFFLLLLQLQGVLPLTFQTDIMFHFYFVGGISYALTFLFLQAQRIMLDMLKRQLVSLKMKEDMSQIGNWSWEAGRDTIECSDSMYQLLGMQPARLTYASFIQMVDPDDRRLAEETVQEALRDHQPFSIMYRVKRQDTGATVWLHGLGSVVLASGGKPLRIVGTTQDITSRIPSKESSPHILSGRQPSAKEK
ncbi:MAG TPA: PAS domain-containing protein [Nevskiaceae bacterium]|nr:PAS domain-containing protein [Nevskiaceae bacterium]